VTVTVTYTECDYPPYEDGGEDVDGDGGEDVDGDGDADGGGNVDGDSDGDGDGSPVDGGMDAEDPSDLNGGDPPFAGGEDEQPGPCQALPETGHGTGAAAVAGLAVTALGAALLAGARRMRRLVAADR
jgi:LPXTG-motif cell wall-anchored protein